MPENENDKQRSVLGRNELTDMIKGAVAAALPDAITTQVQEALAPLQEKQTAYFDKIQSSIDNVKQNTKPQEKGIMAARYLRALAFGNGDANKSLYFAQEAAKEHNDDGWDLVAKSLQAQDFTGAGFLIPPDFANEVIELLRSQVVVRAAGARVLPMPSGSLTLRRHNDPATANYVGEARTIPASEPQGGHLTLTSKKLAALVPMTNDLLLFTSGPSADAWVRDDLVRVMAIREDRAFIRDDGTQETPRGMRYWADANNITATNGTTPTQIEEDFRDLINALETNDVPMTRPAWFMNPRSKNHLINLRDANGNLIYPEVRGASPTLYGYPVFITTSIPINLGGGTETEVYFSDMSECIIGDASSLEIAVDRSASYVQGGQMISAFANDETVMRSISRHDFVVRHDVSVAVKTGVTWGA